MDASLKECEYDVILVGTGMIEAILAGALARVGKKVLHLDQNDYYGSNYASFPLAQFLRWTKNECKSPRIFEKDEKFASESVAVTENVQILPLKSSFACNLLEEGFADEVAQNELLRQSSSFSIDINPRLLLSSEQLVDTLITSGVGRYLEFAAIERTFVHFQSSAAKSVNSDQEDTVWEVPCSKKDVFQSKLLTMVEKRQLMKFLQFVADYGETQILRKDVKTKNERTLALGRALNRPQNKASQVRQDAALSEYLVRPFQELLEDHFKLSVKLQHVVVYCVGLASFPATKNQISAREGLAAVFRYVTSIGRFTSTAFLAPLYGISEVAQSFCRLSAVYGGIYVLRAPIDGFVWNRECNEICGVRCSDGDILRAKNVVLNGSYVDCLHFAQNERRQLLRGVFALTVSLRKNVSRLMLVIPPEDSELHNPFAVHVVQLDVGAYACPKGYFLAQISMPLPSEWVQEKEKQQKLIQSVVRRLILSSEAELKTKDEDICANSRTWNDRIAWRAIFTMDHLSSSEFSSKSANLPTNVWVCETATGLAQKVERNTANPLEIHLESASANARAIFENLCPNELFLPKSASAEHAEEDEQENEENAVLRAAQKIAQQTQLGEDDTSFADSEDAIALEEMKDVDTDGNGSDIDRKEASG